MGAEIRRVEAKMEYLNKEKAKNEEYYKATMASAKKENEKIAIKLPTNKLINIF
jgi:hypothetical protein